MTQRRLLLSIRDVSRRFASEATRIGIAPCRRATGAVDAVAARATALLIAISRATRHRDSLEHKA